MAPRHGHIRLKKGDVVHSKYEILNEIGCGSFSKVYRCWDTTEAGSTRKTRCLAMKVVKKEHAKDARCELNMLRVLSANDTDCVAHVCHLHDAFELRGCPVLIMSLHGPPLCALRLGLRPGGLTRQHLLTLCYDLLETVRFLHFKCMMVHTDLKPENVLMCGDATELTGKPSTFFGEHWVICDFGSSSLWRLEKLDSDLISTRPYRAPEVILGNRWHYAVDIWSLGCIFYEVATGRRLFEIHDDNSHLQLMSKTIGKLPELLTKNSCYSSSFFNTRGDFLTSSHLIAHSRLHVMKIKDMFSSDPAFASLLLAMLAYDPQKRVTAAEAMLLPIFDRIRAPHEAAALRADVSVPNAAPTLRNTSFTEAKKAKDHDNSGNNDARKSSISILNGRRSDLDKNDYSVDSHHHHRKRRHATYDATLSEDCNDTTRNSSVCPVDANTEDDIYSMTSTQSASREQGRIAIQAHIAEQISGPPGLTSASFQSSSPHASLSRSVPTQTLNRAAMESTLHRSVNLVGNDECSKGKQSNHGSIKYGGYADDGSMRRDKHANNSNMGGHHVKHNSNQRHGLRSSSLDSPTSMSNVDCTIATASAQASPQSRRTDSTAKVRSLVRTSSCSNGTCCDSSTNINTDSNYAVSSGAIQDIIDSAMPQPRTTPIESLPIQELSIANTHAHSIAEAAPLSTSLLPLASMQATRSAHHKPPMDECEGNNIVTSIHHTQTKKPMGYMENRGVDHVGMCHKDRNYVAHLSDSLTVRSAEELDTTAWSKESTLRLPLSSVADTRRTCSVVSMVTVASTALESVAELSTVSSVANEEQQQHQQQKEHNSGSSNINNSHSDAQSLDSLLFRVPVPRTALIDSQVVAAAVSRTLCSKKLVSVTHAMPGMRVHSTVPPALTCETAFSSSTIRQALTGRGDVGHTRLTNASLSLGSVPYLPSCPSKHGLTAVPEVSRATNTGSTHQDDDNARQRHECCDPYDDHTHTMLNIDANNNSSNTSTNNTFTTTASYCQAASSVHSRGSLLASEDHKKSLPLEIIRAKRRKLSLRSVTPVPFAFLTNTPVVPAASLPASLDLSPSATTFDLPRIHTASVGDSGCSSTMNLSSTWPATVNNTPATNHVGAIFTAAADRTDANYGNNSNEGTSVKDDDNRDNCATYNDANKKDLSDSHDNSNNSDRTRTSGIVCDGKHNTAVLSSTTHDMVRHAQSEERLDANMNDHLGERAKADAICAPKAHDRDTNNWHFNNDTNSTNHANNNASHVQLPYRCQSDSTVNSDNSVHVHQDVMQLTTPAGCTGAPSAKTDSSRLDTVQQEQRQSQLRQDCLASSSLLNSSVHFSRGVNEFGKSHPSPNRFTADVDEVCNEGKHAASSQMTHTGGEETTNNSTCENGTQCSITNLNKISVQVNDASNKHTDPTACTIVTTGENASRVVRKASPSSLLPPPPSPQATRHTVTSVAITHHPSTRQKSNSTGCCSSSVRNSNAHCAIHTNDAYHRGADDAHHNKHRPIDQSYAHILHSATVSQPPPRLRRDQLHELAHATVHPSQSSPCGTENTITQTASQSAAVTAIATETDGATQLPALSSTAAIPRQATFAATDAQTMISTDVSTVEGFATGRQKTPLRRRRGRCASDLRRAISVGEMAKQQRWATRPRARTPTVSTKIGTGPILPTKGASAAAAATATETRKTKETVSSSKLASTAHTTHLVAAPVAVTGYEYEPRRKVESATEAKTTANMIAEHTITPRIGVLASHVRASATDKSVAAVPRLALCDSMLLSPPSSVTILTRTSSTTRTSTGTTTTRRSSTVLPSATVHVARVVKQSAPIGTPAGMCDTDMTPRAQPKSHSSSDLLRSKKQLQQHLCHTNSPNTPVTLDDAPRRPYRDAGVVVPATQRRATTPHKAALITSEAVPYGNYAQLSYDFVRDIAALKRRNLAAVPIMKSSQLEQTDFANKRTPHADEHNGMMAVRGSSTLAATADKLPADPGSVCRVRENGARVSHASSLAGRARTGGGRPGRGVAAAAVAAETGVHWSDVKQGMTRYAKQPALTRAHDVPR